MKFGLGTANFGSKYGKLKTKFNKIDLKKTINYEKFSIIDTAPLYKNSEHIIGQNLFTNKKIYTKISPFKYDDFNLSIKNIKNDLAKSLSKLKKKRIEGILFHNENDLKHKDIKKIFDYIFFLKKNKIIKKIGVSVYDINKMIKIINQLPLDFIQLPLNILSISKKEIEILKLLKKNKIEIHARSLFLQGMLLQDEKSFEKKFNPLKRKILQIKNKFNPKNKQEFYNILISAVQSLKIIDCCIMGFKDKTELKYFKDYKYKNINIKTLYNLNLKNKNITDPRKW